MVKSAHSIVRMLRVSPEKLNNVAKLIRRVNVFDALQILKGTKRRISTDVIKGLLSAINNAEQKGLKVENLYIDQATVGKNITLKRTDFKGRSRTGRITKPFSQIRIDLKEILI